MGRRYKTSEEERQRAKSKRDAIKAAGGQAYADLLAKERAARAAFRKKNPGYWRAAGDQPPLYKTALCAQARQRGRKRGLPATIMPADLIWPTHCPVLGIELDYPARAGQRGKDRVAPNWPSLDRFDPTKGYVPGNVFVVSFRANTLKNNGSLEEFQGIVRYLQQQCVAAGGAR